MRNTGTARCEFEDVQRGDGSDFEPCPNPAVGEAEVWWSMEPIQVCDCHLDDCRYLKSRMTEPRVLSRSEMGV